MHHDVDSLVLASLAQDCNDSSALTVELLQSGSKPSMASGARGFIKLSQASDEKLIFSLELWG